MRVSHDGEVLRFRPRGFFEEPPDGGWGEPPDPPGWGAGRADDFGSYGSYGSSGPGPVAYSGRAGDRLGELTQVVLVGDQVVDVVRRPVAGSDYECAALELRDRGLLREPLPPPPAPAPPPHERQLAWLARVVGGVEALEQLGTDPLELEELRLDGLRHDLRDRLAGIDERLTRWAPPLLGDEGLPAARRLLTRAVGCEPGLVTRSDRDDLAAGAVLWAVAKGNDLIGTNRPLRAAVIQEVCGLRSTPSQRGSSFAHAVGGDGSTYYGRPLWMFDCQPAVIPLGSPDLLLSRFRRRLVLVRDLALQLRARTPAP
jgi:hypothetical protein